MIARLLRTLRERAKFRAVAQIMGIRVLQLAGNVLSGLLTAAVLGPSGRGELAALVVAPAIVAPLCTIGLHASVIYNVRADPSSASRYFGNALMILLVTGVLGALASMAIIPYWLGPNYSADTIAFARVILLIVPLNVISPAFSSILEASGRFSASQSVLYLQSLGALVLLGALAALGLLTPHSAAICYCGLAIPTFFYLSIQACRCVRPHFTLKAPFPQRLLRLGVRFYGVDILGIASGYLDQVVIVFFLTPGDVGNYAVALSLARMLGVAQASVQTVLFPSIAARDVSSVVEMVGRVVRITTVINVAGAMCLGLTGPFLLRLLYGVRFSDAVAPFLVLLMSEVVTSAARTLAQAFSGSGRPSAVTALELAGVIGSVAAMFVLVPYLGIMGSAYAALLGACVRLIVAMVTFRPLLGVQLPRLWINRMDISWVAGR